MAAYFRLWPTAQGPCNYLNCSSSSGHFVNLLPVCASGTHFWFKYDCRPRTSPAVDVIILFGGKIDLSEIKKLNSIWSDDRICTKH